MEFLWKVWLFIVLLLLQHCGTYGQMSCVLTNTGQPCVPSCIPAYSVVEFTCALKISAGRTQWNISTGSFNCSLQSLLQIQNLCSSLSVSCGNFTASNVPTSGPCLNSTLTGTIYSGYNGVIQCASVDQSQKPLENNAMQISSFLPGNTAVIVNVINSMTVSLVLNQAMAKICGVEVRNQAGTLMLSRNASTSSEYVYVLTLDQTVPVGTTSLNFTVTPCCGGNINAWWAYPLIPQTSPTPFCSVSSFISPASTCVPGVQITPTSHSGGDAGSIIVTGPEILGGLVVAAIVKLYM